MSFDPNALPPDLMALLMGGAPLPPDPLQVPPPVAAPAPLPAPAPDMTGAGPITPGPNGLLAPPDLPTPRMVKLRTRLRPFKLKKAYGGKPPKKPKAEWILEEAKRRQEHWSGRDRRMDEDLRLYLLADAQEDAGANGEEKITRVTPRAMVDKLSYMVGRQRDKIKVRPRLAMADYKEAAQNVEDFLYAFRRKADLKHQSKLSQGLGRDEAWFAAQRGWVASRVYLNPDDDEDLTPCLDLYDARNCYPQMGMLGQGQIANMIYVECLTVSDFLAENPDLADHPLLDELESSTEIDVVWYEDCYYSILLIDETVARSVTHDYGFCPWAVNVAAGPAVKSSEAREHFGSGVVTPLRHVIKQTNRILSSLATGINRYGNPTTLRKYNSQNAGQAPEPLDLAPGADNIVDEGKGQGYEILNVVVPPMETQLLMETANDDLAKQGIVPVLWGTPEGMASGFHQAVAVNAAEDALFPITNCIIQHRQWQNRLALLCVLCAEEKGLLKNYEAQAEPATPDLAPDNREPMRGVMYPRRRRPSNPYLARLRGESDEHHIDIIQPSDIETAGIDNEVFLRRMTPTDLLAMVQAGAMANQSGLLDREFIREEWLDVDDPVSMNLNLIFESIFQDEEFMREFWMPLALKADPEVYSFYQRKQQEKLQAEAMAAQPAMMGAGPPLPATPGIPSQMLPPPMQAAPQPGAADPAAIQAALAMLPNMAPPG